LRGQRPPRAAMPVPLRECPDEELARIRCIATDMDGTFLAPDHKPSAGSLSALEVAEKAGITFIFATGRNRWSAQKASGMDVSDRPGLFLNGTVMYGEGGALKHEETVPPEDVAAAIQFASEHEGICALNLVQADEFFTKDPKLPWAMHLHEQYGDPVPQVLPDSHEMRFHCVHILSANEHQEQLYNDLKQRVSSNVAIAKNLPTNLAMVPAQANKGKSLHRLATEMGFDIKEVLGVGDGGNDVELVTEAGIGVAVGNGIPVLKAAAKYEVATNAAEIPGVQEIVNLILEARERIGAAKNAKAA